MGSTASDIGDFKNGADSSSDLFLGEVGTTGHGQHTEGKGKNEGDDINEFLFFGRHIKAFLLF